MVCLFVSCSECSWFVCLNLVGHMLCLCTSIDLLWQWKLWWRSDVGCLLACFMPRMLIVCCLKLVEVANVFIGSFRSLSAPSTAAAGQARRITKLWCAPVFLSHLAWIFCDAARKEFLLAAICLSSPVLYISALQTVKWEILSEILYVVSRLLALLWKRSRGEGSSLFEIHIASCNLLLQSFFLATRGSSRSSNRKGGSQGLNSLITIQSTPANHDLISQSWPHHSFHHSSMFFPGFQMGRKSGENGGKNANHTEKIWRKRCEE